MERKPKLRVIEHCKRYAVTYPCGGTADLWLEGQPGSCGWGDGWHWRAETASGVDPRGGNIHRSLTLDGAMRQAWCQVRPAPATLPGINVADLAPLEQADRSVYTRELRKLLKNRTGRTWSVKGSTGTAYSWIDIAAPPARRIDWSMSADDQSLLAATLNMGSLSEQHEQIPPTRGYRHLYLALAAGLPTDEIICAEHGWD